MTPTQVNGLDVIATEEVQSPLSTKEKPIFFSGIRELLLADGSSLYACRFCWHTDVKLGRVRAHQTYHCDQNPNVRKVATRGVVPRASNPPKGDIPSVSAATDEVEEGDSLLAALDMVLGSNARITELTEQRDAALAEAAHWRAKCAEKDRAIQKVRERLKDLL